MHWLIICAPGMQGMDSITPGTCYRLSDGRVIRVMSVFGGFVRFDVFDETNREWYQSEKTLPVGMLKEQQNCPVPRAKPVTDKFVTCPLCGKRILHSDLFAHSPECSARSVDPSRKDKSKERGQEERAPSDIPKD